MGIENRDYMRDGTPAAFRRRGRPAMQNIVKTLIIITVITFLAQIFVKAPIGLSDFATYYDTEGFTAEEIQEGYRELRSTGRLPEIPLLDQWFALDSSKVLQGQVWRLLTYCFLHSTSGPVHIFINMFMLHMLGRIVVDRYGGFEFLLIYLASGVFAGVVYVAWSLLTGQAGAAVGASGSVMALLTLVGLNWPMQQVKLYFFIPMTLRTLLIIAFGFEVFGMINEFATGRGLMNIAHSAHLGGMIFAFIYFRQAWHLSDWIPVKFSWRFPLRRRRSHLRIHRPAASEEVLPMPERQPIPPEVALRVDELLEKISRSGEASLTPAERDFLHESSRRYR